MALSARTVANRRLKIRNYPYALRTGTDGYLAVSGSAWIPNLNSSSFSMAFWFKTGTQLQKYLCGFVNSGNTSAFGIVANHDTTGAESGGRLGMFIRDQDNDFLNWATSGVYQFGNNKWQHLVVTGIPSTNTWNMYLNAVDLTLSVGSPSGVMNSFLAPSAPGFLFGARNSNGTPGEFSDSIFAEILIYQSVILTQTQVTELYYEGTVPGTPHIYLKCDEGTGTTVNDSSGSSLHAVYTPPTGAGWVTDTPMKARTLNSIV
jgi:hypothetical protein